MSEWMLWLLQAALLAALLQPIMSYDVGSIHRTRPERYSHVDRNEYMSDNLRNLMENKTKEYRFKNPQNNQMQQNQPYKTKSKNVSDRDLNQTIRSIFQIGPEEGLTLFNNTFNTHMSHSDQMQADESFFDRSPYKQQAYKKPTESQPPATPPNRDFVFPDQLFIGSEPKCNDGLSESRPFCTKVNNYPALNQLESILKSEFSNFEVFFSDDWAQPQNITQRMNHEPDEEYLCASVEKVIYPEAAMTKDSNWLLIVNNHNNYKQGVRIEECLNEGEQCNIVQFPNHYTATCKQNFIYRSLVAITPNGTITKDHFKMPSCCKCVLKQVH